MLAQQPAIVQAPGMCYTVTCVILPTTCQSNRFGIRREHGGPGLKLKKRKIKASTCFGIGVAGGLLGLLGGILAMVGVGPALYAQNATLIVLAAMLLLLATTEKGDTKRGRRVKLLVLALLLVAALPRLPVLDWPEALALPLMTLMYRQKGDAPFTVLLLVFELGHTVVRAVSITSLLGPNPLWWVGLALALVSTVRGAVLLRMCLRAMRQKPKEEEPVHTLR